MVRPGVNERSPASHDTPSLASVDGDGAVWPPVEQEVSCLFQPLRATRLVGSAGSIGHFSWPLLFGPAKRSGSLAGRPAKARRRRAISRPNQNQNPWPNERAAPDPPLIPAFSPEGRRSQERKPVAGEPAGDHLKQVRRTEQRPKRPVQTRMSGTACAGMTSKSRRPLLRYPSTAAIRQASTPTGTTRKATRPVQAPAPAPG